MLLFDCFLSKELGVDHMMNDGTEEEQKVRAEMTRGFKVNICSSRLFRNFPVYDLKPIKLHIHIRCIGIIAVLVKSHLNNISSVMLKAVETM